MTEPNVTPGGHGMGWRRDNLDHRDIPFMRRQRPKRVTALPTKTNNRLKAPPVLAQGNIGSCTANSAVNVHDFHRIKMGLPPLRGSRLAQYYNTRVLEGTVNSDSGASIRNTIKAMNNWGTAPETMWPYDIPRFREKPPDHVYVEAEKNQVLAYYRLTPTREELMEAHAEELVVLFGFLVFEQFENLPRTGVVNLPRPGEQPRGGHSGISYDYETRANGSLMFHDQNSWGDEHGDQGWAYFPEEFLLNRSLCDDFWAVEVIEREEPPAPPPPVPPVDQWLVGPGFERAMVALGDRPAADEWWPFNKAGDELGWGVAPSGECRLYLYVKSLRKTFVVNPDHVFPD